MKFNWERKKCAFVDPLPFFNAQNQIRCHGTVRSGINFNVVLVVARSRCNGNKMKRKETNENYIGCSEKESMNEIHQMQPFGQSDLQMLEDGDISAIL